MAKFYISTTEPQKLRQDLASLFPEGSKTAEDADVILVLCPAGPEEDEVDDQLKSQGTKTVVLVVMHQQTCDLPNIIALKSRNLFVLHCLYSDDKGILEREKTEEAFKIISKHVTKSPPAASSRPAVDQEKTTQTRRGVRHDQREKSTVSGAHLTSLIPKKEVKFFPFVIGQALNVDKEFMSKSTAKHKTLRTVGSAEQSSVILAFCPIVSRYGTNIEEALRQLKYEKPVVLVVMHHTSDPEYVVPSSSVYVKDRNIFTVDCLFFDDKGMLNCQRNYEAYDKVVQKLKSYR
uniref:Uncharacterized protein n=1 Tax=Denticeps clupeoides TaxID=299321 RepID=A0AAY4CG74_9TELE